MFQEMDMKLISFTRHIFVSPLLRFFEVIKQKHGERHMDARRKVMKTKVDAELSSIIHIDFYQMWDAKLFHI